MSMVRLLFNSPCPFQALAVVKDLQALWTNRAQAYIKLGRYEEALSDCDWALRVRISALILFNITRKAPSAADVG